FLAQYSATGVPPSAWAACSPVRTLMSCSGDGPPKITAGLGTAAQPTGAPPRRPGRARPLRGMIGQLVLVQDGVARPGVGAHPADGVVVAVGQDHGGPRPPGIGDPGEERGPVGVPHDDE